MRSLYRIDYKSNKKGRIYKSCFFYKGSSSHSFIHIVLFASLGIFQSPLGERLTEPTFGPSGRHERLNCWLKKRLKKIVNHFCIVLVSYFPLKACLAKK